MNLKLLVNCLLLFLKEIKKTPFHLKRRIFGFISSVKPQTLHTIKSNTTAN